MKNDYIYCKSGFNIIRIPFDEYKNKEINSENVEILMWKNGQHVFEKNDLSILICNEDNIFALDYSTELNDLLDEDIEKMTVKYKEKNKTTIGAFVYPSNAKSIRARMYIAAQISSSGNITTYRAGTRRNRFKRNKSKKDRMIESILSCK